MLEIRPLIDTDTPILPALASGQIHAFSAVSGEPLVKIVTLLKKQTSVLYICDARIIKSKRLSNVSELNKAEIKLRKRFNITQFLAGLENLSRGHKLLVLHLASVQNPLTEFLLDDAQLVALENWATQHQKIVCLWFNKSSQESSTTQDWLTNTESRFQSLTSFDATPNGYLLRVHYWFHRGKVIMNDFRIIVDAEQQWQLDTADSLNDEHAKLRYERAPIYYESTAITGTELAPVDWHMIDNKDALMSMLERNSDDAVIISFYRGQNIIQLMKTVFNMRQHLGRYIRIYIRELDQVVRHTDEQLLLHAGATLLLPMNLKFGQIVSLIESSVGWRFPRDLPSDFAVFEQRFVPRDLQGYRPLQKFVTAVRTLTKLANEQSIDCTLVLATPGRGMHTLDVLSCFNHRRDGDLISNAGDQIPIFLFGCRAQDVTHALEFLLGAPLPTLFAKDVRLNELNAIMQKIDEFSEQFERNDYTDVLASSTPTSTNNEEDGYRRTFPQKFASLTQLDNRRES